MATTHLYRVRRGQCLGGLVEQFAGQRTGIWPLALICMAYRMLGKKPLYLLPQFANDDWCVLTGVASFQVANFASIDWIRQQLV